jgi:hypothetical protein
MPMEPERPIEKLLRECAETRRRKAEPPLEMHPATRKLLQGEVARRHLAASDGEREEPAGGGRFPFSWALVWPRLSWALTMLVALGLCAFLMLPSNERGKGSVTLAKAESRQYAAPAVQPAPASVAAAAASDRRAPQPQNEPVATPPLLADNSRLAELRTGADNADRSLQTSTAAAAVPAAPSEAPVGSLSQSALLATNALAADAFKSPMTNYAGFQREAGPVLRSNLHSTGQAPSTSTVASSPAARPAAAEGESLSYATQRYAREWAGGGGSALDSLDAKASILTSFEVKQSGNRLQMVDSDGSVYEGNIELTTGTSLAGAPAGPAQFGGTMQKAQPAVTRSRAEPAKAEGITTSPVQPSYRFRVTGTNRTLNANVVFTGNLNANTNNAAAGGKETPPAGMAGLTMPRLSALRISGSVVVGGGKEAEVMAVPVTPPATR